MIQQTSLESYQCLIPMLGKRQQQIYEFILKHQPVSNNDISRIMGLSINQVTPRVKELRDYHMVWEHGLKYDRLTQRNVMTWRCL